ncbi:hypothetical protein EG68_08025 [Paragonimus skrjabini miyazakii]|uniref:Cadherin domain-containing protein n=1 Tax=Paragonimus skrjabini miyazakii TaxID=59628 RepID=A0A8S9YKE9_9TREM|nr:hypothetical protein EG68_08025 [Paragonimus skrjabini miyazakii]
MLVLSVISVCSVLITTHTATFPPVLSDDRGVPFAFTSELYDAVLIGTNQPDEYIIPLVPHMGVPEPFGGNPSGTVEFIVEDSDAFTSQTRKLGKFFFLQLLVSTPEMSRKRPLHEAKIRAIFTSESQHGIGPIRLQNTSKVRVHVLDRNENCPFFSQLEYQFSVRDDISLYESFGQVVTTDADSGFNAQAFYYLDPADESLPFRVDPFTGKIYATRSLNKYIGSSLASGRNFIDPVDVRNYHFKVYATQRGDSSQVRCNLVSVSKVHVNIIHTNKHAPAIIMDTFSDIMLPGISGMSYARISVVDKDSPPGFEHTLRIVEPDMREKFQVVPTGKPSEWLLQVRRNLSSISLSARIMLTLEATDENIHRQETVYSAVAQKSYHLVNIPLVSKSTYRLQFPKEVVVKVSEAALPNCTVAILKPDVPYSMTNFSYIYTILQNGFHDRFTNLPISLTSSGAVVLKRSVDVDGNADTQYRGVNFVKIIIPFTTIDRNNLLLSSASTSQLVVEIFDINDNDPVVRNNGSVYEVSEDAAHGTLVLKIDAFDPDLSKTELVYALYNSRSLPFILTHEGELLVDKPLDAETMPNEFIVYVWVSDSGVPLPRSVLAVFIVHILDVNEYPPQFVELSCKVWLSVTETGSLPNMNSNFVLGRYSAEDADRDKQNAVSIRLASSSLSRPCFKVDATTGEISVVCTYLGSPNSDIMLTLLATDGTRMSEVPFELTIHLVSGKQNKSNFPENCQQSNVYDDLKNLRLRKNQYELLLKKHPQITSFGFNRHRPKFPSDLPTRIHIPENLPLYTAVLQFAVSDEDGADYSVAGKVVYGVEAINSVPAENFALNSSGGVSRLDIQQAFLLRAVNFGDDALPTNLISPPNGVELVVSAPLDREMISSYSLILHACDLGSPQLCASSQLHIFLEDLDDNPPEFSPSLPEDHTAFTPVDNHLPVSTRKHIIPGVIMVPEDVPVDARIGQVTATDRDVTDEVRYRLISHTNMFKIHPKSGRIKLLRGLDRETQSAYELVIEAVGQTRQKYNHHRTPSLHYLRLVRLAEANNRALLRRSTLTRILITVMDVNDNVPVFIPSGLPVDNDAHTHLLPTTTFDIDGYNLFIPEDMPEGAFLITLTASDADDGVNGLVGYSLFGNPKDIECFHVEELTGVIRLTPGCNLSKLRGRSIRLAAWAFDHGTPQLTTNTTLTIHVIAVHLNIFPPTFQMQPALYSGWIAENQNTGSPVVDKVDKATPLRLHAIDPEGASLSFVVSGGSGMGYFYVDDHGLIRTRRVLDAESLSDEGGYWLTVYAVEEPSEFPATMNNDLLSKMISSEVNGPMRTLAEVFIEVADENDNYPVPLSPEFSIELSENSPPDVLVATIPATDLDRNTSLLHYRISAGDPQGHFTISTESGSIRTTARPLDREAVLKETGANQLLLVVSISDRDSPQKSCQVHILITLLDENDQTPKFIPMGVFDSSLLARAEVPIYHFRVYESEQDKSGCVGRVIATDLDDSLNGSVFYWRDTVSNAAADVVYLDGGFDVLSESGLICTDAGPLEAGEYRIRVFAKDRGQPARIANDNRPVAVHISILRGGRSFTPGTQRGGNSLQFTYAPPKTHTLQDNLPCGHQLFTFAVSDSLDPTGLSLTYFLTTPDNSIRHPFGLGQISPSEGFVFLAERLNLNRTSSYVLVLTISNGYTRLNAKTRVSVTPFDNRRPVFSPEKFSKDALAHIDVTDLSEAFHILGAAGYQVQARLNESVLVGSLVCRLEAHVPMTADAPVSSLEYSVVTVGQDVTRQAFSLNTQTGELRVAQPLDHETISQHYLLISARRMNSPSLSTFINVFVNVSDTNEHAPQFLTVRSSSGNTLNHLHSVGFTFFVNGMSSVGTVVGRVTAVDPDSGDNGRIRYSIVGENNTAYFEIDSVTGDLRISKPLLHGLSHNPSIDKFHSQWVHEHRIIVAASDNGRPVSRSNHTFVSIQIVPGPGGIDAPAPRFHTTGTVHFNVAENTPPNYVIASLSQLLTMDSVAYGFLHFDLVSAYAVDFLADHNTAVMSIQHPPPVANLELFHVTANTGLLVTLVHLDRERHGDLHRLVVRVKGSSGIRAEIGDYLMLEIQIIDVNDNTPTISTPRFIRGYVSEDAPPGSLVMQQCVLNDILDVCAHSPPIPVQIIATDPDLGLNGQIVYQLMSASAQESARLFKLDSTNGLLRVSPDVQLDRETTSHHSLFVQVSDSGSPARTADNLIRIEIEVLDVNDSPPMFGEAFYMRTLMLPTYPTELIVQLSATDPDVNDTVSYRFSDQLSANYFTLDALTGHLRVAANSSLLDQNLPTLERNFLVVVEAYDCHKPKPHVARVNVTVFAQLPSPSAGDSTPLIVDPEGGLDVNLVEHYAGHEPLRLGLLKVRNAPVGAIYRFIVLTPQPGLTVDRLTGTVLATGDQSADELDRERTPNVTMHVLVRDMHNRLGRAVVRIHLSDINDHTPLFIGQPYHAVFCLSSAISTDRLRPDTELPCRQNHFQVRPVCLCFLMFHLLVHHLAARFSLVTSLTKSSSLLIIAVVFRHTFRLIQSEGERHTRAFLLLELTTGSFTFLDGTPKCCSHTSIASCLTVILAVGLASGMIMQLSLKMYP